MGKVYPMDILWISMVDIWISVLISIGYPLDIQKTTAAGAKSFFHLYFRWNGSPIIPGDIPRILSEKKYYTCRWNNLNTSFDFNSNTHFFLHLDLAIYCGSALLRWNKVLIYVGPNYQTYLRWTQLSKYQISTSRCRVCEHCEHGESEEQSCRMRLATRNTRSSKVANRKAEMLQSKDKRERPFQNVLGLSTEENVRENRNLRGHSTTPFSPTI